MFFAFRGRSGSEVSVALDLREDLLRSEMERVRRARERHESDLRARRAVVERMRALRSPAADPPALEPGAMLEALRHEEVSRREARQALLGLSAQWDELQGLLGGGSLEALAGEADARRAAADDLLASAPERHLEELRARAIADDVLAARAQEAQARREAGKLQLARRREAERRVADRGERAEAAAKALRRMGERIGVEAEGPAAWAAGLESWLKGREEAIAAAALQSETWDRLQRLLGEGTLEELAAAAARRRASADELLAAADAGAVAAARRAGTDEETLDDLAQEEAAAAKQAHRARGELAAYEANLPRVADAEDAHAAAQRERERVLRLKRTLDCTIDFLERAQERVMRDIAPTLTGTLGDWLPRVTDGRYGECRIDPESLKVEVRTPEGRWRAAELLSHGTTEQIYLLLRFALSRHLTKTGESCPLILDDVVGAADAERKKAVLRTLGALAESTQVILFTHEEDVRDWAARSLAEPGGRLIELSGRRRGAGVGDADEG